jgi:DNA invertase Pin-like site-specific DNA recombinase
MRKPHNRYVAYYRVSTAEQGRSGLGLEAQREAVARFFNGDGWEAIAEFTEVESGKRGDRPQLEKALAASRLQRCPLVVTKMDRLTRSVSFLSRLLEAGVDVRFADLPAIEGPTGRFMLQQMAAVAELEAGLISSRTKAALAAAKARGKVLGGNRGTALSEQAQAIGRAVQIKRASERAADLRPMIRDLQQSGVATALRNRTSAKRARRANGTWWALLDSHPGRTGVGATAVTLLLAGPLGWNNSFSPQLSATDVRLARRAPRGFDPIGWQQKQSVHSASNEPPD